MKKILLSIFLFFAFSFLRSQYSIELVKDGFSSGSNGHGPEQFIELNGKLLFTGASTGNGTELWISDGTTAGTMLLKDINPGTADGDPTAYTLFNGKIYFCADDGVHGRELWVTDGTTGGTMLFKDIKLGSGSSGSYTHGVANGKLFFAADDGGTAGYELWATDGTSSNTAIVKDINPTAYIGSDIDGNGVEFNGKFYFVANDGVHGPEVWYSDGSSIGTQLLKDIIPGTQQYYPAAYMYSAVTFNNRLYFIAQSDSLNQYNQKLWRTDGSPSGTVEIDNSLIINDDLTIYHDSLYFTGTWAGWRMIDALDSNEYNNFKFFDISKILGTASQNLVLQANDTIHGYEPMMLADINSSLVLVKDIYPGTTSSDISGSNPYLNNGKHLNGNLVFVADDGQSYKNQIWISNGISSGTVKVLPPFNPGQNSFVYGDGLRAEFKNAVYFVASYPSNDNHQLYRIIDSTNLPLAVNKVVEKDFQIVIYPNPTTNQLFIETNGIPIEKINIYNTTGSLVSQPKQPQDKSIDIGELATGVYIAEIKTKETSVRRMWVKM